MQVRSTLASFNLTCPNGLHSVCGLAEAESYTFSVRNAIQRRRVNGKSTESRSAVSVYCNVMCIMWVSVVV
jgi:hypothetical protein